MGGFGGSGNFEGHDQFGSLERFRFLKCLGDWGDIEDRETVNQISRTQLFRDIYFADIIHDFLQNKLKN